MKIHIKIHGQTLSVDVSIEVSKYFDQANHKTENLAHEKRRHWDDREYDDHIIVHECNRSNGLSVRKLCRKSRKRWGAVQKCSASAFCFSRLKG